jgi:long-chain acyl-CoA synthetase
MNVYESLLQSGREEPDRAALEYGGAVVTYGELASRIRAVAGGLRARGIGPGDGVGVMLPNTPEFVACTYGTYVNGSVVVPLNVMLTPPELRHIIADSKLRLLVAPAEFLPRVLAAVEGLPSPPALAVLGSGPQPPGTWRYEDLAASAPLAEPYPLTADTHVLTIYTSGTSGRPKGAMLSSGNITSQADMIAESFGRRDGDRALCVIPLFHAFALNSLLGTALRYRGTVVLHPRFDLEACVKSLREDRIAWFASVPTIYAYLLKYGLSSADRFPHLRYCLTGGAPMPLAVMRGFEQRFGVPVYDSYGLSETTSCVCLNRPGPDGRKLGSVGKPLPGAEVRALDESGQELPRGERGELVMRGPNLMLGYLNQPRATRDAIVDGWFHSGDIGWVDDDGFVHIIDRMKDLIIKGGFNIYPREIEEVLHEFPGVAEAAVVGVHDDEKGELVRAVIAARPGMSLSEQALREHVGGRLARYKHPSDYHFVAELPKGPTGKILKRVLRDRWSRPVEPTAAARSA